jgi:hypothetical protein
MQSILTVEATFETEDEARAAAQRLIDLRHDESNPLVGGATHVDGATVTTSLRLHPDASSREHADTVIGQVAEALAGGHTKGVRGGGVKVHRGELDTVEEQYVDEAGQVQVRPANRVVHSETGETVRSTVRKLRAIDDDGNVVGEVAVRTVVGEDGRKIEFPQGDPADQDGRVPDIAVTADEVGVQHTPGE